MAEQAGESSKNGQASADDGRLYDTAHDFAVHMSERMQSLEACADRIALLALDLRQPTDASEAVRERVKLLAKDIDLWTALTLRRMTEPAPVPWLKGGILAQLLAQSGPLVPQVTPACRTRRVDLVAEVLRPLDGRVKEWLRLFDSGLLKDLALELHGLASAVREAAEVFVKAVSGGEHEAQRLLELARREGEAIARLSAPDVSKDGEEHGLETWDGRDHLRGPVVVLLGRKKDMFFVGGREMRGFNPSMFLVLRKTSSRPGWEFTTRNLREEAGVMNPWEVPERTLHIFAKNGIDDPSPIIHIRKERRMRLKWIFQWKAEPRPGRPREEAINRFQADFP